MRKPPKPRPLTEKQAAFRDLILEGHKPSPAYVKAFGKHNMGPRLITIQVQKLLKNPNMRLAINLAVKSGMKSDVMPALSPHVMVSMQRRLDELSHAMLLDPIEMFDEMNHFKSIREMPEHLRRAIHSFEVDPVSFVLKVRMHDKLKAIMNYSTLAGDIPNQKGPIPTKKEALYDLSKLSNEQMIEYMKMREIARVDVETTSDDVKIINPGANAGAGKS